MKDKLIRNALIKQTVVIVALLTIAGGGLIFVSSMDDGYTSQMNELQSQTDKVLRDMSQLRDQYAKVDESAETYKELERRNAKNALTLNRIFLRDTFNTLRKQYNLGNLKINMTSPRIMEGTQYKRDSGVVEASDVVLSLESISDENVFFMLDALEKEIIGIQFTNLSLQLVHPVDAIALQEISQRGTFPLVKGELKFAWFGINTASEEERAANAPLTTGGGKISVTPAQPAAPRRVRR